MTTSAVIDNHAKQLARLAPGGYFFALHIRGSTPLIFQRTFPEDWVEHYNAQAYALRDPVIAWGLGSTGMLRWSAIDVPDPFDIMAQAKAHGMIYGVVSSCGLIQSRTIASATRDDREFTDQEMAEFHGHIEQLHAVSEPPKALTHAQAEALRCIANGDRHAAAAAKLNISESALKARLTAARNTLLARTTAEAIQRARDYQMI